MFTQLYGKGMEMERNLMLMGILNVSGDVTTDVAAYLHGVNVINQNSGVTHASSCLCSFQFTRIIKTRPS